MQPLGWVTLLEHQFWVPGCRIQLCCALVCITAAGFAAGKVGLAMAGCIAAFRNTQGDRGLLCPTTTPPRVPRLLRTQDSHTPHPTLRGYRRRVRFSPVLRAARTPLPLRHRRRAPLHPSRPRYHPPHPAPAPSILPGPFTPPAPAPVLPLPPRSAACRDA